MKPSTLLFSSILFLSSIAYSSGSQKPAGGVIAQCTKACEGKVKELFKAKYQEIYNEIKTDQKKKKQFHALVIKNYDVRIQKGSGSLQKTIQDERNLITDNTELTDAHFDRISQIDMMNNDGQLMKQFGPKDSKQNAVDQIFIDYPSPFAAGMACIAECRDPDGKTSGRDTGKAQFSVRVQ